MSNYETLIVEQAEEIMTVTLNRPKLNLFHLLVEKIQL